LKNLIDSGYLKNQTQRTGWFQGVLDKTRLKEPGGSRGYLKKSGSKNHLVPSVFHTLKEPLPFKNCRFFDPFFPGRSQGRVATDPF